MRSMLGTRDSLVGGAGNDSITGDAGDDILNGGSVDNVIAFLEGRPQNRVV